ncbi:hypothetical protein B0T14DRAFT_559252 [Immersiella caudata]|uniref:Heterokaryon incompatibility domain-containing protein n=1 Tax=Immersiella caudata TaxID=314043 RepID=A0AA40CAV5_9PEZI|nr:hypothetical protein B0T14DRAFT_559252 [Immersiella caudata]
MPTLTYRQVAAGGRAIRTLRLLPGRWMDQINCELQEACLDDHPAFEALFYVWGNVKDMAAITVDGCSFQATKNLIAALRRLRSSVDTRILWVNAIFWAGVLEVIENITYLLWWNRVWVLQEAVLPLVEVRAIYGEINAPMAFIEGAGGILRRHHFKGVGLCYRSLWESLPSRQKHILSTFEAKMGPLGQIREIVGGWEATDPYDIIYGILGLLSDCPNPIDLKPDYETPVGDLFAQLAYRFLMHFRSFHKLINHELPLPETWPLFYLPSWVPHWGHTYGTRDLLVQRPNSYVAWPSCPRSPPAPIASSVLQVWEGEVMKITNNVGADVIIETGGAETLYKSLDCVAFGDFYKQHQIRLVVDRVFGFQEAKDAFKYLVSGSHFGKVVVKFE